ncbi:unnamed protein product [Nippostrongylus brasiliensis]|uniref:Uncharacterized protein n=1 Tax=Nippostrongylus brasiliensis TaxID=27835 RepID=A0A0N4YSH4_NIPBR|nr:unnamed protein product [Nippostrongylus brasiliensis]
MVGSRVRFSVGLMREVAQRPPEIPNGPILFLEHRVAITTSPTAAGDDELVSVLFTIDQLLRMCHVPANGPITLKLKWNNVESDFTAKIVITDECSK